MRKVNTGSGEKRTLSLLAIDIGNTSINVGLFVDGLIVHKLNTRPLRSPLWYRNELESILKMEGIDKAPEGVVISSVVPGHTEVVKEGVRKLSGKEPLVVSPQVVKGLKLDIKSPEELGADRLTASFAAVRLFGAPVAVVDFGTATTVNFVGSGNVYKGGAILPGIGLMSRALWSETAKLPKVEVTRASSALGKNTADCILSGIIYGTAGAVERIISEVEELEGEQYKVAATGGFLEVVLPNLKRVDFVEPALVLKGLKIIYEAQE
jgi:type III pantothenate kinase